MGFRFNSNVRINNYGLLASGQRICDIPNLRLSERNSERNSEQNKAIARKGEYSISLSTFDYIATVEALLWVADVHRYSHFLTIAPFGSKLQALGTFIFTRIHPETQIVYACPKDLHPRYSEGVKAVYEIPFSNPRETEQNMDLAVNSNLAYLNTLSP